MLLVLAAGLAANPCAGGIEVRREYQEGELRRIVCRKIEKLTEAETASLRPEVVAGLGPESAAALGLRRKQLAAFVAPPPPLKTKPRPEDFAPGRSKIAKLIKLTETVVQSGAGEIGLAALAEALQLDALLSPEQKQQLGRRGMLVVNEGIGVNKGSPVSGPVEFGGMKLTLLIGPAIEGRAIPLKGGGFALLDIQGLEAKKGVSASIREIYIMPDRIRFSIRFKTIERYLTAEEP